MTLDWTEIPDTDTYSAHHNGVEVQLDGYTLHLIKHNPHLTVYPSKQKQEITISLHTVPIYMIVNFAANVGLSDYAGDILRKHLDIRKEKNIGRL